MHFIIIKLTVSEIGGRSDGGFIRYSEKDGVQKGQGRRSTEKKRLEDIYVYVCICEKERGR